MPRESRGQPFASRRAAFTTSRPVPSRGVRATSLGPSLDARERMSTPARPARQAFVATRATPARRDAASIPSPGSRQALPNRFVRRRAGGACFYAPPRVPSRRTQELQPLLPGFSLPGGASSTAPSEPRQAPRPVSRFRAVRAVSPWGTRFLPALPRRVNRRTRRRAGSVCAAALCSIRRDLRPLRRTKPGRHAPCRPPARQACQAETSTAPRRHAAAARSARSSRTPARRPRSCATIASSRASAAPSSSFRTT